MAWNSLPPARPDPIFAVAAQARAAGKNAIDASIGVYLDEGGGVKLFPSVRKAMQTILQTYAEGSFTYSPLLGLPEYRHAVTELIFPGTHSSIASVAAVGGTGAVAINLRMLLLLDPGMRICIPTPAWANHAPLCRMAGIAFEEVPALKDGAMQHQNIINWVKKTAGPCAVLLQAGGTNPTGIDLTEAQWRELIPVLKERECTVLLDFAYQGLASDPATDAKPARALMEAGVPTLLSWSASKNHSIYRLRTGLALANVPDEETKAVVEAHYSMLSRGLWSTAPAFGQIVVAQTQMHHRKEWLEDLAHVRGVLERKRAVLRDGLPVAFHASLNGRGLFAVLPLQKEQIAALRKEHGVFLLDDGRINIAGIPDHRMEAFCSKVTKVYGSALRG